MEGILRLLASLPWVLDMLVAGLLLLVVAELDPLPVRHIPQLDHAWLSAGFLLALRAPIGQNFMKRLMEDGSNDAALDSLMRSQFSRQ